MIKVKSWELDMSNKNYSIELLESNLNVNELEKIRLEDEIKALKQKNDDLEKSLGKIKKEEEEKFEQLMIENSVLKCEKKKAESEIDAWKAKCNELEMRVLELQKEMQLEKIQKGIDILEIDLANMNEVNNDKDGSGVQQMGTLSKCCINSELGNQSGLESRDKKHIDLTTKGGQHRNVCPSASGIRPSVDVADISDSDDNLNLLKTRKKKVTNRVISDSDDPVDITDSDDNLNRSKIKKRRVTNRVTGDSDDHVDPVDISDSDDNQNHSNIKKKRVTKRVTTDSDDPVNLVDISNRDDNPKLSRTRKRKVPNRVTSDGESDDPVDTNDRGDNLNSTKTRKRKVENESDDDVPLSKLRSRNLPVHNVDTELTSSTNDSFDENLNPGTRSRRRLNKLGKKSCEISKFMNDVDDDNEKDEDDLETDSMEGFIVHGSDASEDHSASDSKEISENDGTSSGESQNESENSMAYDEIMSNLRREKKQKVVWEYQADMLADFGKNPELCMEAVCAMCRHDKVNGHYKGQGFNMYDGAICNELALIMTDGHPDGEVKKTVEELQTSKPGGIQLCIKYAKKYSRQLFEIYESEQDPYFHANHLVHILNKNM